MSIMVQTFDKFYFCALSNCNQFFFRTLAKRDENQKLKPRLTEFAKV